MIKFFMHIRENNKTTNHPQQTIHRQWRKHYLYQEENIQQVRNKNN
jgi:hypothetical protein